MGYDGMNNDEIYVIAIKLIELLLSEKQNFRLSSGERWLVGEEVGIEHIYTVYEKKYYSRQLKVLYHGNDLLCALEVLDEWWTILSLD